MGNACVISFTSSVYKSHIIGCLYILNVFQVRKARNGIMHTADMKLSDADLQDYSQAMIDLLKDPGISCFPTAQLALAYIQSVRMITKEARTFNQFV